MQFGAGRRLLDSRVSTRAARPPGATWAVAAITLFTDLAAHQVGVAGPLVPGRVAGRGPWAGIFGQVFQRRLQGGDVLEAVHALAAAGNCRRSAGPRSISNAMIACSAGGSECRSRMRVHNHLTTARPRNDRSGRAPATG